MNFSAHCLSQDGVLSECVGITSQEKPVPSFLLDMRSAEARPSVLDDTAFTITPTEDPEGFETGSSGSETYRSFH